MNYYWRLCWYGESYGSSWYGDIVVLTLLGMVGMQMSHTLVALHVTRKKCHSWMDWINQLFHHFMYCKWGEQGRYFSIRWNALLSGCLLSQSAIKAFECPRETVEGFKRQWKPEGFLMLTDVKASSQNELCTQWTRIRCFNIRNQLVCCTCTNRHTWNNR